MSTPLSLTPPAEVTPIKETDLQQELPGPQLEKTARADLTRRAHDHATNLAALDPLAPDFQAVIRDIEAIGDRTITSTTDISNRLLDSPDTALSDKGGTDTPVAMTLTELRRTVDDLDPSQATKRRKLLGMIPFGNRVVDYLRRFESQRSHLDGIVERLNDSRDELRKDNAVLEQEKVRLWEMLGQLNQDVVLTQELDRKITETVEDMESSDPEKAAKLRDSALFYIRQKHQDLLTHAAVSVQSYLAINMVISNNTELSKGVHRATTTTMSALTTTLMTAQALKNQQAVTSQVEAVNHTASGLIERTAEMNKTNSVAIQKQAAETTLDLESLRKAFDSIYETMDEVDAYRAEAATAMGSTITSLRGELARAEDRFREVGASQ